jgi:hypothetical protein
MSFARGAVMLGSMMTYYRAWENQRFVRGLLREKQPELATALEAAVREPACPRCDCSRPEAAVLATSKSADLGVLRAVYAGCRLLP